MAVWGWCGKWGEGVPTVMVEVERQRRARRGPTEAGRCSDPLGTCELHAGQNSREVVPKPLQSGQPSNTGYD